MSDEEYHGRELRRLEQKAARAPAPGSPAPALDDLTTYLRKLRARQPALTNEVRDVFTGATFFEHSTSALNELDNIDLPDLKFSERATGRALLIRVLAAPGSVALSNPLYTSVALPVASPSGRCAILRLHCYPLLPASLGRPSEHDVQAVFPEGTILAVKEPVLGQDLLTDEFGVDVYSPAEVEIVEAGASRLDGVQWTAEAGAVWELPQAETRSMLEWSGMGDKALAASRYREALRCYSLGISQNSDDLDLQRAYLRRAALNITLERYASALDDAQHAIEGEAPSGEALAIKARALYLLRRWSQALAAYQQLGAQAPESEASAASGVAACEARLREASTGEYDIAALYHAALDGPSGGVATMTDVADHVGPVRIGPSPSTGGGRGLITTRDVFPGEVLLAVRSVAAATASDLPKTPRLIVYNLEKGIVDTSTPYVYVQNVLWRLMDQPELASKVYDLYLGDDDRTPTDFPLSAPSDSIQGPARLDAPAVFRASFWNASFPHKVLPMPEIRGDVIEFQDELAPGALFSESAMINHSCAWTVSHTFYGDFQITRASQFIPAGTEVFASYVPDLPLAFRQTRLGKFFGVCQCDLCQADSADPGVRERADKVIRIIRETSADDKTFADITGAEATSNSQLAAIVKRRTEMARDLDGTYDAEREMARVDLFFGWEALRAPLRAIAERKRKEKEYLAFGRNEVRCLVALGVDFTTESVMGLGTPSLFPSTPTALGGGLPIRTPPPFRPIEAARSLVLLASICARIAALPSTTPESAETWTTASRAWLQTAAWVEHSVVGGGRDMFADRWAAVLAFEGLSDILISMPETIV